MSLFSFRDIKFKAKDKFGASSSQLIRSQGLYESNLYRYPVDIGNYDKGHYMVIHVNQQRQTSFEGAGGRVNQETTIAQNRALNKYKSLGGVAGDLVQGVQAVVNGVNAAKVVDAAKTQVEDVVASGLNKLDNLGTAGKVAHSVLNAVLETGGGVADAFGGYAKVFSDPKFQTNFARTIERTKDTIVLYMPDTLSFDYNQTYTEPNLGGTARMMMAGVSAADQFMKGNNSGAGKALAPFLLSYLTEQNDLTKVAFSALTGTVVNPMIEVIYSTPQLRQFRFDFMFYPRSTQEGQEVQKIINTLRFHQSPEVNKLSKGYFMVPPSEFDIEFYANGKINENIDKVSTCVLEGISVDYAPNGFAAYETLDNDTGLGKTGMPVAIRMSLSFKETEYMTKDNYTGDQYRENAETRYISYREGMIKSADSNYQDIPQILNPETESMPEIYYGAEDIPQSTQE